MLPYSNRCEPSALAPRRFSLQTLKSNTCLPDMIERLIPTTLILALAIGCNSAHSPGEVDAPMSVASLSSAYELAGSLGLPEVPPQEYPGLHNVFVLSPTIISGSEPNGRAAFEALRDMGVKTILSVDGKTPEAALAAQFGMRYVHSPIRYKGIDEDEIQRIAKTFHELEPPFFVHCFHGKHRGPAAAAVGRVVLDGVERERALAEMRQWCGTSSQYSGLYTTIARTEFPSAAQSAAFDWDFPQARPMQGFRQSMVEIPRLHDNIEVLSEMDWELDPEHPDIEPLNEAQTLLSVFRQANELEEVQQRPAKFQRLMAESVSHSERLVEALKQFDKMEAFDAFESLQARCTSCHRAYRNRR